MFIILDKYINYHFLGKLVDSAQIWEILLTQTENFVPNFRRKFLQGKTRKWLWCLKWMRFEFATLFTQKKIYTWFTAVPYWLKRLRKGFFVCLANVQRISGTNFRFFNSCENEIVHMPSMSSQNYTPRAQVVVASVTTPEFTKVISYQLVVAIRTRCGQALWCVNVVQRVLVGSCLKEIPALYRNVRGFKLTAAAIILAILANPLVSFLTSKRARLVLPSSSNDKCV